VLLVGLPGLEREALREDFIDTDIRDLNLQMELIVLQSNMLRHFKGLVGFKLVLFGLELGNFPPDVVDLCLLVPQLVRVQIAVGSVDLVQLLSEELGSVVEIYLQLVVCFKVHSEAEDEPDLLSAAQLGDGAVVQCILLLLALLLSGLVLVVGHDS